MRPHRSWEHVDINAGVLRLPNAKADFRHTAVGTFAGRAGLNAFTVRDILGHKTLAMTGRYVCTDTTRWLCSGSDWPDRGGA